MSDDGLDLERLSDAFVDAGPGGRDAAGHPAAETIWAAAAGELPAAERDALLEHTIDCGACAENWRLALEVHRAARPAAAAATPGAPSAAPRRRWLAAFALAGAAAIALFVIVPREREPGGVSYREESQPTLTSLIPDGARLPRGAFVLKWSAGPAGSTYTIEVTTETLEPVFLMRGIKEPSARVPAHELDRLPGGTKVFWHVEGRTPKGPLIKSPTYQAVVE